MNGDIDLPAEQCILQLFGKKPLIEALTGLAQPQIHSFVALRLYDGHSHFRRVGNPPQSLLHQFSLSQRQLAASRAQADRHLVLGHCAAMGEAVEAALRSSQAWKSVTYFSIKLSHRSASSFRASRVRSAITRKESRS